MTLSARVAVAPGEDPEEWAETLADDIYDELRGRREPFVFTGKVHHTVSVELDWRQPIGPTGPRLVPD